MEDTIKWTRYSYSGIVQEILVVDAKRVVVVKQSLMVRGGPWRKDVNRIWSVDYTTELVRGRRAALIATSRR